jgi:hypothetical protein
LLTGIFPAFQAGDSYQIVTRKTPASLPGLESSTLVMAVMIAAACVPVMLAVLPGRPLLLHLLWRLANLWRLLLHGILAEIAPTEVTTIRIMAIKVGSIKILPIDIGTIRIRPVKILLAETAATKSTVFETTIFRRTILEVAILESPVVVEAMIVEPAIVETTIAVEAAAEAMAAIEIQT